MSLEQPLHINFAIYRPAISNLGPFYSFWKYRYFRAESNFFLGKSRFRLSTIFQKNWPFEPIWVGHGWYRQFYRKVLKYHLRAGERCTDLKGSWCILANKKTPNIISSKTPTSKVSFTSINFQFTFLKCMSIFHLIFALNHQMTRAISFFLDLSSIKH